MQIKLIVVGWARDRARGRSASLASKIPPLSSEEASLCCEKWRGNGEKKGRLLMLGSRRFYSRKFLNSSFGPRRSSLYSTWSKTIIKEKFSLNFCHCKDIFDFQGEEKFCASFCKSLIAGSRQAFPIFFHCLKSYSWVAGDVTKNQTRKLSILLSFYFHEVLQYLNTFT